MPRDDEVPPLHVEWVSESTGTALFFTTGYQNEDQDRALFDSRRRKFLIRQLPDQPVPEPIALIAGFVSEMANAHPCDNINNRVWIQIS